MSLKSIFNRLSTISSSTTPPTQSTSPASPTSATSSSASPPPNVLTTAPLDSVLAVTVVIPALNEAKRIAEVVQYAWKDPIVKEVIVIDDSSTDSTVEQAKLAGAKVMTSSMLGKGGSMHDGVFVASHDVIAYMDGDLTGLRPNIISDMIAPIAAGRADFVKASFGRGGGRVTELTAKPMLKIFFPELAHFQQPLGGLIAARKSLLKTMHFEDGYGVDVGLLIDAFTSGAVIEEVEIGSLAHDSQGLSSLAIMAQEVGRVIMDRAKRAGRLNVDQIMRVYELERQNQTDIGRVMTNLVGCKKLVLLDMDGTISTERFVIELAKATGQVEKLLDLLDGSNIDASTRSESIAALFRFVHRSEFEKVAKNIKLRPDVVETVNQLRRMGYKVGVVSDSYYVAAEIIRRRIFADFALAHSLQFDNDVCQGKLHLNRAYAKDNGCAEHAFCKSNVLRYIIEQEPSLAKQGVYVVGDNYNDLCLLESASSGAFAIDPKHESLKDHPKIQVLQSFSNLLFYMQSAESQSTGA